jgi:GWxTD domain-containing protein
MRLFDLWVHGEFAKALGWTLLHSLWEGAAIALALALVLGIARSSRVRYGAACLAMVAMLIGFGGTFWRLAPLERSAVITRAHDLPLPANAATDDKPSPHAGASWDASDFLPWLAPAWMLGVLLFQLRCLASWAAAGRMRGTGICGAPEAWTIALDRLRARLKLTQPVMLMESCLAEVPVVIGHLRPVILMPVGLLAGLPAGQIESILLHELAHISRADYLVNLVQTFFEGLLFYHPAAWWISRVIRAERENCCDDLVVETSGNALEYASALAALAELRTREVALAATGGNLVERIRRLLARPERPGAGIAPILSAGVLVVTCALALAAWQTPVQNAPAIEPKIPVPQAPILQDRPLRILPATEVMTIESQIPVPQASILQIIPPQVLPIPQAGTPAGNTVRITGFLGTPKPMDPAMAPYRKWIQEEVPNIITKAERLAFWSYETKEEKDQFIEQFWERRNPTPGSSQNAFRDVHYRRIAYVNDRFATAATPGWRTDRGRIYIVYGPPDEIDSHPTGGAYTRPAAEGGGQETAYPFEQWRYRHIEGLGNDVVLEFVDRSQRGEYKLGASRLKTGPVFESTGPGAHAIVIMLADRRMRVTIPIEFEARQYLITESTTTADGKTLPGSQSLVTSQESVTTMGAIPLPPGFYTFTAVVKDTASSNEKTYVVSFTVN